LLFSTPLSVLYSCYADGTRSISKEKSYLPQPSQGGELKGGKRTRKNNTVSISAFVATPEKQYDM